MATAKTTTNHAEIRRWAKKNGAVPSHVKGTGVLRFDFGDREARLEPIEWDQFFQLFDDSGVALIYEPDGRFNKFVEADDRGSSSTAAGKTSGRKASGRKTSARKTTARKTTARKSTARKKTAAKKAPSRKKAAAAKKTTARKATSARKNTATRKKTGRR